MEVAEQRHRRRRGAPVASEGVGIAMSFRRPDLSSFSRSAERARLLLAEHRRLVAAFAIVLLGAFIVTTVSAARFAACVLTGLPDREQLKHMGRMAQSTALYDAAGRPVFTLSKEERMEVPLAAVSPRLVKALLAIEDQRFFEHGGIDPVRVFAATMRNLREGRAVQGASTITQQLARQTFLSSDKTLRRKLREIVLAGRIERMFTKREILELYLNKVYFGDGLYGAEAASRGYFGKPSAQLTIAEAALLAGLVKSPSAYAPTYKLNLAVARRNVVLQRMFASHAISRQEYEEARSEPVALHDGLQRDEAWGQNFKEQVRRELIERFGYDRIYQEGLRVYTTLDPAMQKEAEGAVAKTLAEIEAKRAAQRKQGRAVSDAADDTLEAALVAIDPNTGFVRAMVGGRNFSESAFNRAVQARRQPGSAFKPFVYAAALESGFTPATLLDHLDDPIATPQGDWTPDDEHSDGSPITLRTALRTSSNRAAVRLLQQIGIGRAVDYAQRVGMSVPSVPSLALGSGEVSLVSLTAAYVPFADGGLLHPPVFIQRVDDRAGNVLYAAQPSATRVISQATAFLMTQMLADVLNAGTAYKARAMGFTLPAAGKTGTTNGFDDIWFVGYTPHLLTGVWIGFDQPQTILRNGFAGDLAVPLWTRFMIAATKGAKPDWYSPPSGVVPVQVCRLSGKLPSPGCEHVPTLNKDGEFEDRSLIYTEYFARGSQPTEECPLHRDRSIFDRVVGLFGGGPPAATPTAVAGSAAAPGTDPRVEPAPGDPSQPKATDGPPKKKGFWGKVFGVFKGKKDKDGKEREKKEPG
jgi:penicillin-binding protein 1A